MPPVMGAAAFLMVEFIGIPYGNCYSSGYSCVTLFRWNLDCTHFEAKKMGLRGLKKEEMPDSKEVVKKLYLLTPIMAIIVFC